VKGVGGVGFLSGVTQVGAGDAFSCALAGGTVYCWGDGQYGQLGNNSTSDSGTPVAVIHFKTGGSGMTEVMTGAVQLVVGRYHACARNNTGVVKCWGRNDQGQLGINSTTNSLLAVAINGSITAAEIMAGHVHTCARTSTNTEVCWGDNSAGQIGDGTSPTDRLVPTTVINPTNPLDQIKTIGLGGTHSCAALDTQGTVCWGSDGQGQLGNGASGSSNLPSAVQTLCP